MEKLVFFVLHVPSCLLCLRAGSRVSRLSPQHHFDPKHVSTLMVGQMGVMGVDFLQSSTRMLQELNRTRRSQGWFPHWQARVNELPRPAAPVQATAQEQIPDPSPMAAAASTLPVKAALSSRPPMSSNQMMANAPRNPPFPNEPSADPWSKHTPRHQ